MPTALRTIPPSMVVEDSFMLQRAIVNSQLSEVIDSNSALVSPSAKKIFGIERFKQLNINSSTIRSM
jgi:hypothetical protein